MLVLRLIGMLAVILIGSGIVAYLATKDRRYLALSWRVGKYSLIFALVILTTFFLERVIVL
jgi:hypothetical protein